MTDKATEKAYIAAFDAKERGEDLLAQTTAAIEAWQAEVLAGSDVEHLAGALRSWYEESDDPSVLLRGHPITRKAADTITALVGEIEYQKNSLRSAVLADTEKECQTWRQRAEAAEAALAKAEEREGEANSLLESLYDALKQLWGEEMRFMTPSNRPAARVPRKCGNGRHNYLIGTGLHMKRVQKRRQMRLLR